VNQSFDTQQPTSVTGQKIIMAIRRREKKRRAMVGIGGLAATLMFSWVVHFVSQSSDPSSGSKHQDSAVVAVVDPYVQSLAWLSKEQLPSGAWDVERWSGKEKFKVGVSAMAMIAIMKVDESSDSESLKKALGYLMSEQSEDGHFGPMFLGDLYNQSLATLALRQAKERGLKVPDGAIKKAQAYLERYRVGSWEWAYRASLPVEKNLSAWANLAMDGRLQPDGSQLVSSELNEGRSPTFKASVLISKKNSNSPMEILLKTSLKPRSPGVWEQELMAQQVRQGELAGSWPLEGPWSHVGGRVFTTSIALLSLRWDVM
jgi:hypothetical protein